MLGWWAQLCGSRDCSKASLMPKSSKTHQDQEPITQQVLFWLSPSCPRVFFCFLKTRAVASSQRSPQAPQCVDTVTLHCDLAVTKLARLNAIVKVTGQRCWEEVCMAAPEQPHWTGALCPREGASCTHGMYSTAPAATIQTSATRGQSKTRSGGGCLGRAARRLPCGPAGRWAVAGKSRGCRQSGRRSHCHTAAV